MHKPECELRERALVGMREQSSKTHTALRVLLSGLQALPHELQLELSQHAELVNAFRTAVEALR